MGKDRREIFGKALEEERNAKEDLKNNNPGASSTSTTNGHGAKGGSGKK